MVDLTEANISRRYRFSLVRLSLSSTFLKKCGFQVDVYLDVPGTDEDPVHLVEGKLSCLRLFKLNKCKTLAKINLIRLKVTPNYKRISKKNKFDNASIKLHEKSSICNTPCASQSWRPSSL